MMHALQRKYEAVEEKVDKIIQQGGIKSGQVGENKSGPENVQPTQVNTTESQHDSTTNEPLPGQKCKILSWYNKGEIVAEGSIANTNPNAKVNCRRLGQDAWRVWIEVALVPDAELYRNTDEASVIGQAEGSIVAWSKYHIQLVP